MNSIGWQIGGVLIGVAFIIAAVFLARTLNSAKKLIDESTKVVEGNEKDIRNIIENTSDISDSLEAFIGSVFKIASFISIVMKKKRKKSE